MENGLQEFAEQMLATAVVGKDQDVVKVLTSVEVGDDLKDTTMTEVVEEKVGGGGGAEGGEGEEEEDVYSMEVSDELEKRNEVVAKEAESTAVAVAPPELDKNDDSPKEEDVTMSTINDEPTSESGAATERGPAEIPFAEPAAGAAAAAASEKEDVTDLNETPKLELENESEEMRVNEASPTPPTHDLVEAAEELEVPQESPAKSEAVKDEVVERVIRPALDVNEPAEALKTVEGVHSDVAPFRNVRAEEAKALHDAETKMVSAAACVANEAMESAHEDVRAAAQGEEEVAQVKLEPKDEGQSSGQVDDIRSSQSQPNGGADMAVDAKEGDAGVVPKAEKTELEREMELYEASEREEQVWLLAPTRVEQQCEEPSKDVQNDRKRALDMPTQERQRKQSRRTHAAEERKKDEEDVCFICFDGGDLVMCDRRSCPKAYHLSCIGRDAAFFKKKGAWLCGWHFCSVCTKPGSFQCYTCPTAYCGSCIQEAEFLMLRKRKGLCEDCLPIVSMIERNETTNADGVEVDFEDQDTYECLFKEYWEDLKRRLSLIMPELDKDGKPVGGMGSMLNSGGSETEDHSENEESDRESDESEQEHPEPVEAARKGRGKGKKDRMGSEKMEEDVDQEEGEEEGEGEGEEEEVQEQQEDRGDKFESWASQELLGFIEHMKEDPTKPLSRFAVNKLLWSYIKRHSVGVAWRCGQRCLNLMGVTLRECVEKLQELSSPAFRAAKLQARPEVSADPHMDPGYESDVNEMSPLQVGGRMFRAKGAASSRWEKGGGSGGGGGGWDGLNVEESSFYPGRKGDADGQRSKSSWEETSRSRGYGRGGYDAGRSGEKVGAGRESSYGVEAKTYGSDERDRRVWDKDWDREQTREQERGRGDAYNWSSSGGRNGLDAWGGEVGEAKYGRGETRTGTTPVFGQPRTEWGSTRREAASTASVSSTPVGFGPATPSIQNLAALEKEKLWHYQDPTGTVQGPFTMEQLRKWNTTGLFPVTLTIWKTGQSQAESMLLTDALAGRWKEEIWGGGAGGAGRSRSRELVGGGSPTPRANSAWSVMEGGLGASRGEVGAAVSSTEWESRDAAERGGSWARVASSFGGVSSGSGRAVEEWSGARARAEPESWGGPSRKGDGSSWGGSESGKSTYGRSNSSREYEGAAGREGSRSSRGPRGSKKDVPCRFYAKGYCKRGDACEFWHG
uniref:Uncharacterized protein n=2 Tax=Physcomitrium patens TaxID=3218 RepID=A0A7I4AV11_PHYPA